MLKRVDDYLEEETNVEVIKASKHKCYCRGSDNCKYSRPGFIPEGQLCLRIKVYGAGGPTAAYYCAKHMGKVLEMFQKCLDDYKNAT